MESARSGIRSEGGKECRERRQREEGRKGGETRRGRGETREQRGDDREEGSVEKRSSEMLQEAKAVILSRG